MTPDSFSKEQKQEIVASLRRYFADSLDQKLSDMQAGFLLEYFLSEIAPFAYNKGVDDARRYFFTMTEDLTGACFEEPLTFWKKTARDGSRDVRRKQGG